MTTGQNRSQIVPLAKVLALFGLAGFVLLPLAQTVILSFTSTFPREGFVEGACSLVNYRTILDTPALMASILNWGLYVLMNIALCLTAALPAAYAFSRYRFTGDRHFFFI